MTLWSMGGRWMWRRLCGPLNQKYRFITLILDQSAVLLAFFGNLCFFVTEKIHGRLHETRLAGVGTAGWNTCISIFKCVSTNTLGATLDTFSSQIALVPLLGPGEHHCDRCACSLDMPPCC